MIYGINFNGQAIPKAFRHKFAAERLIYRCKDCDILVVDKTYHSNHCTVAIACSQATSQGGVRYERYRPQGETGRARLQGVCTSWDESRMMCIQADNGHRKVWRVRRATAGTDFYGIYCY